MKKALIPSLLFSLSVPGWLSAANIAWVSFHAADDSPSTNAATAGFTQAPDIGYTNLLTGAGHTVTRFVSSATPNAEVLNAYDLVIVSRSTNSANFQSAGATAWNGITAPMIVMSGYSLRSNRMGFTSGETMVDTFLPLNDVTDTIRLTAANPSHPIFAGISLDGSNVMTNPFSAEASFGANVQNGISVNTNALAAGGTLIASVGTPGDPANGGTIIAEWLAGVTMGNAATDTLAGHRLVFLSGTRERNLTGEGAGIFDLTADGSLMFLNAVDYMAVPEPSHLVLAFSGGLVLLRRRR